MLHNIDPKAKAVHIETGNMLSMNNIMLKVWQSPVDELVECLKIVAKDSQGLSPIPADGLVKVGPLKNNSEVVNSFDVEDKKDLKINVKVFVTRTNKETLIDAVNEALLSLETDTIDSLVLACPCSDETQSEKSLPWLQELWRTLEDFVESKKIISLGLSNIDTQVFISLYNWAKVKPSIVQVNLATCCVVPPALQEFSKQNDIQLNTTSDPADILPKDMLQQILDPSLPFSLVWVFRYQVQVKCRGVLASKGYVVCCKQSD
ncbi:glutamate--cysteine ligase regulatory subunit [Thrips palmi]|uniref:GCS light chain n=1 Tax=Thrips palmi TaxID=161013 RepID=A0A6P8Y1J9_THRPL|nr:glutamate--cysteine ligase regulatory subunit [Thrips palmi]